MPGEFVCVDHGRFKVGGQLLAESYASGYGDETNKVCFTLGNDSFLLARDIRTPEAFRAGDSVMVADIHQIIGRCVFTFWPREDWGVTRTPAYNIPNPPLLRIRVDDRIARMLVDM
jgi:hypothetical protein